jgi:Arc/MetJ family transcription regulator
MRTNIVLDDALVDEALKNAQVTTKREQAGMTIH